MYKDNYIVPVTLFFCTQMCVQFRTSKTFITGILYICIEISCGAKISDFYISFMNWIRVMYFILPLQNTVQLSTYLTRLWLFLLVSVFLHSVHVLRKLLSLSEKTTSIITNNVVRNSWNGMQYYNILTPPKKKTTFEASEARSQWYYWACSMIGN